MTAPELLVLSFVLSFGLAASCLATGTALERCVRDPDVRDRAWAAALYCSVLPILTVALLLLTPAPTVEGAAVEATAQVSGVAVSVQDPATRFGADQSAMVVLGVIGLLTVISLVRLAVRSRRLSRLVWGADLAPVEVARVVRGVADEMTAPTPPVRIGAGAAEAMIVGLWRPVLLLPKDLARRIDEPMTRAIIAHELAHLKRSDHRTLWIEEALLCLFAANPVLAALRRRRATAREEACDRLALKGAPAAIRRSYARALLDALNGAASPTDMPALTFTSAKRTFAMLRLKAILEPAPLSRPLGRYAAVALGSLTASVALAGSMAVAAQREPVVALVATSAPEVTAADAASMTAPALSAGTVPVSREASPEARPIHSVPTAAEEAPPVQQAALPAPEGNVITSPVWAQHPMPEFPAPAAAQGVTQGSVVLSCAARQDGRLSGCSVVSEDPAGNGFAAAALRSVGQARLAPATVADAAPGSTVRFTIRFRVS